MNRKERRAKGDTAQHEQEMLRAVSALFSEAFQHAQARRMRDAILCLRRAVKIAPEMAATHYNLGNALAQSGELKEAIFCFRKAIALNPKLAEAYSNLAAALLRFDRFEEAQTAGLKAVEISPNSAVAWFNLGAISEAQRRLDDAADHYQKAIGLRADFPAAHTNLAMVRLAQGDFAAGWAEYEWRWKTSQMASERVSFDRPQWRGEHSEGKTLLIHSEQGFGDTIQFCRYGAIIAAYGLKVIMQVQPPLVRLLQGLAGVDRVIGHGEKLPAFDFHSPMLSLPFAVGTKLETVPSARTYLPADETNFRIWRDRIARTGTGGLRIGLAWAGHSRNDIPDYEALDQRRSISLEKLNPLLQLRGADFFSLQKDHRAGATFPVIDLMPEVVDFADTAALMANLDLVISVDTAVAHLAAALGKPVWLLNRYDSCWRWIAGSTQTPWYPSMRIYNQVRRHDWDPVVGRMTTDLIEFIGARSESGG